MRIDFFFYTNMKMTDPCPICFEEFDSENNVKNHTCNFPVCNHKIHVSCMLQAAQYDIRCPICRTQDPNIVSRGQVEHPNPGLEQLEEIIQNHRIEERRYKQRRAKLLRENKKFKQANEQMKKEKKIFTELDRELERRWMSKQRKTWKMDSKINELKEKRRKQQQKTARIAKKIDTFVEEQLGPRPNGFFAF